MVGGLRPSGSPARRHQNCGFFRELSCESAQVEKRFPRSSVLPRKARSRLPFHSILRIFHASIPSDSSTTTRTSETDEKSKVHWSDSIRLFLYFILTIGNHVACVKPPKGVNLILLNSRTVAQLSLHHSYCNLRARIIFVATSECCGVSFDCGWHSRSIYFCAFFTPFFLVRGGPLTQTQNKNKSHSVFSRKSEIQQEIMMMMSSGPKSTRRGRPNCYT